MQCRGSIRQLWKFHLNRADYFVFCFCHPCRVRRKSLENGIWWLVLTARSSETLKLWNKRSTFISPLFCTLFLQYFFKFYAFKLFLRSLSNEQPDIHAPILLCCGLACRRCLALLFQRFFRFIQLPWFRLWSVTSLLRNFAHLSQSPCHLMLRIKYYSNLLFSLILGQNVLQYNL